MKLILFLIFLAGLLVLPVAALTPEEQAREIRNATIGTPAFAYALGTWVIDNIYYSPSLFWAVNSTDLTWKYRVGDCSEFALLFERMAKPYMNVQVVHGEIPGVGYHDTVKWKENNVSYYYDNSAQQGFIEHGLGLAPGEFIIEYAGWGDTSS